ncbi:helix-turn-helix domain-containing protein [Cytophaga sp. FL35]|uniref:helix-turn-helix domain-containing protein n=1 Tax=Cytophaga sp. FL35 TaxID=1904456 RepID=UPI00165378E5|nr:helix-turn-helix domain-containing protein [Cytophaga sp. FL35]MBC6998335.1 helix-turn-helix domain-containing protein [Cytophaga sp. FL35]
MQDQPTGLKFTEQAKAIILEHLSNENFGVSELAEAMHMSRSNLLRKCKKHTALSASQFIRKTRLEEAMELLKESELTVSEVSYQVGFGSSSYFIKCFRELYGYPPGEVGKGTTELLSTSKEIVHQPSSLKKNKWLLMAGIPIFFGVIYFFYSRGNTEDSQIPLISEVEKSIAVLPFKNESNDASNLYFVNGLMEASLGNLQKIEDLRVISRTSVEKYRNTQQNIGEIAKELNVSYVVEGSGQKMGNQVLLNIQLIDATTDSRIWGEQYTHELEDIFALQNEVAKKIADAIKAKVTPLEIARIDKKPTENLVAYDYFLQAQEQVSKSSKAGLEAAIPLYKKALEEDSQFALAYANLAIAYFYLDQHKREKQYTEQINNNADKALLYDSKLTESLIAKALYYQHTGDYRLAVPHLQKALEYNPNSSSVVQLLSALYSGYIPNTGKYLENALKGIQLDIAANDSIAKSYIYLNLSNALAQSGFIEEALEFANLSLQQNPANEYTPYLKAYIQYAQHKDLEKTLTSIKRELMKDTMRLDLLQETAKLYYFQRKYDSAYHYYKRFHEFRVTNGLKIYPHEDIKISWVYKEMGQEAEAKKLFESYAAYCERDESIYQPASMAVKLVYEGQLDKAIEQYKKFATKDHFQYWIILFMRLDPVMDSLTSHPEYEQVLQEIENCFWDNHDDLKETLEEQELL